MYLTRTGARFCLVGGLVAKLGVGIFFNPVSAQIIPDTTLGTENSHVTEGVDIERIDGGAVRGANLFHSFQEFNVLDGQQVYFANPAGIENILSRVTGGNPSDILGTLGVLGNANLFLVNPNGIVFGPNTRLDVAGSFVASTANGFDFPDGSTFSSTNPEAPPLLTINLAPGLQWGTSQPQAEIVNRGNLKAGQDLTLAGSRLNLSGQLEAGRDLTLLATDTVQIRDSAIAPFIAAAGGELVVQGNQAVDIFALNHPDSGLFSGGDMVLRSANTVGGDAHYWSGGSFRIEQLDNNLGSLSSPNDPVIRASGDVSFGSYTGASLHIFAGGSVTVAGDIRITGADATNGIQETVTLSDGTTVVEIDGQNKSTLDIRAGTTAFGTPSVTNTDGFSPSEPNTVGIGTSANITIGGSITNPGGLVFLTNQYNPNTLPGNITVGSINTSSSLEDGGSIFIDSRGDIALNSVIDSSEFPEEILDTELFLFDSNGNLLTENDDSPTTSGAGGSTSGLDSYIEYTFNQDGEYIIGVGQFPSEATNGKSAPILGDLPAINLGYKLQVSLQNSTLGSGGTLNENDQNDSINEAQELDSFFFRQDNPNIELSDSIPHVSIAGTASNTFDYYSFNATADSIGIFDIDTSDPASGGNAGNITLRAGGNITTNGTLNSSSVSGNGGAIDLDAGGSINLTNTGINSTSGDGKAGDLAIQSRSTDPSQPAIRLIDTGIDVAAFDSKGRTGNITIAAINGGSVQLIGQSTTPIIYTDTFAETPGGNLTIRGGSITIDNYELIADVRAEATGNGGDILIETPGNGNVTIKNNAVISTTTFGAGHAGNLTIRTGNLRVENARLEVTSAQTSSGQAGDITILANSLHLNRGTLKAETLGNVQDQQQEGANINIELSDSLFMENESLISARAEEDANGGNITIETPSLVVLSPTDRNGSDIIASASGGNGGTIRITAQGIFGAGNRQVSGVIGIEQRKRVEGNRTNDIDASSELGVSGEVDINRGIDPSRGLTELPEEPVDPTQQISQGCLGGPRVALDENKFIVTGRGGLPSSPDDLFSGDRVLTDLGTPANPTASRPSDISMTFPSHSPTPLVEAQNWVTDANGIVHLVAQAPNATPQSPWQPAVQCSGL